MLTIIVALIIGLLIGSAVTIIGLYIWLTRGLDDAETDVAGKYDDSEAYNTGDIKLITSQKQKA